MHAHHEPHPSLARPTPLASLASLGLELGRGFDLLGVGGDGAHALTSEAGGGGDDEELGVGGATDDPDGVGDASEAPAEALGGAGILRGPEAVGHAPHGVVLVVREGVELVLEVTLEC